MCFEVLLGFFLCFGMFYVLLVFWGGGFVFFLGFW